MDFRRYSHVNRYISYRVDECKLMDSKMRPLWMVYENDDDMGAPATLIFKNGDGRFLHFYLFEKQSLCTFIIDK